MAVNQVGALNVFSSGTTAVSADVNQNFTDIKAAFNALITGANALAIDVVAEQTAGVGVTIDGVLLKDSLIANAAIAEAGVTQHQAALAVTAAQVTSLTFADARIAESNVTQHQAALAIAWTQLTGVPSTFTPAAHVHAGADITTGTVAAARIDVLDASKVTTGTFGTARIPNLAASKITAGTFGTGEYLFKQTALSVAIGVRLSTGDVDNRFEVLAEGKIQFGDGTAATDVNLYRAAVGVLRTDTDVLIGGDLRVNSQIGIGKDAAAGVELDIVGDIAATGTVKWGGGAAVPTSDDVSRKIFVIDLFGNASMSTGDGKRVMHIPASMNGWRLDTVHAVVNVAGTTGLGTIQVRNGAPGNNMLSVPITIDSGEQGSDSAATPPTIDTAQDNVSTNDIIYFDCDGVHTTPAVGCVVTLEFLPS